MTQPSHVRNKDVGMQPPMATQAVPLLPHDTCRLATPADAAHLQMVLIVDRRWLDACKAGRLHNHIRVRGALCQPGGGICLVDLLVVLSLGMMTSVLQSVNEWLKTAPHANAWHPGMLTQT